jgi:hypothetical protein
VRFVRLSRRFEIPVPDLPLRWLPLVHLYDPDLPLFPTHYFHSVEDAAPARPGYADRVFGYIERVNAPPGRDPSVTVVCNRFAAAGDFPGDLLHKQVVTVVRERLGLTNPVLPADVTGALHGFPNGANGLLTELWTRVVTRHFGDRLPFGRLWDEVLGLVRFTAGWNWPAARKGELAQTHHFVSRFGERIPAHEQIGRQDFFLLPTSSELVDPSNPLHLFPKFRLLVDLAEQFCVRFGFAVPLTERLQLTGFRNPMRGALDGSKLQQTFQQLPASLQQTATDCFTALDGNAPRTVLFLLMLHDVRRGALRPDTLQAADFAAVQSGLGDTYNSPKAIQRYAQQCWGNPAALPVDTGVKTFFGIPLQAPRLDSRAAEKPIDWDQVFAGCSTLGKVERLLWVTAQARKVDSSACDDALWCIKAGSNSKPRGANPFACTLCDEAIVNTCPAFADIRARLVADFSLDEYDGVPAQSDLPPGSRDRTVGDFVSFYRKPAAH